MKTHIKLDQVAAGWTWTLGTDDGFALAMSPAYHESEREAREDADAFLNAMVDFEPLKTEVRQ